MDNMVRFYEKVQTDKGLQQKIKEMKDMGQEEAIAAILALAKENGFEINREGFNKYMETAAKSAAKNGELAEAELDSVAGGGTGEWVAYSIFSFGMFCAASAVGKIFDTCGLDHPESLGGDRF